MAYYKTPADMFEARAKKYKSSADQHWAMAKNGEGDYHYGKAKTCYNEAKKNAERAEEMRKGKNHW